MAFRDRKRFGAFEKRTPAVTHTLPLLLPINISPMSVQQGLRMIKFNAGDEELAAHLSTRSELHCNWTRRNNELPVRAWLCAVLEITSIVELITYHDRECFKVLALELTLPVYPEQSG